MGKKLRILAAACLTAALLTAGAGAQGAELRAPAVGDELRAQVVERARALSEIEWTCAQDIDFTKAVSWSPNLYYEAGVTYRGLPYTSDTIAGNEDIEQFAAMLDENGVYAGPTSWNEMPGSDCGGQIRLAYAWAGALCDLEMEGLVFDPGEESRAFGVVPLGGYDCSGYTRSSATKKSILAANDEQLIYNCYAMLRAGDSLFVLFADASEHVMLVTGDPVLQRDGNGTLIPEMCSVPVLELNSAIHDRGSYKTNWNEDSYSFAQLYETGFIPLTMEAFSRESSETPAFETDGVEIAPEAGFHALMSGQVRSNYNIFQLRAVITDAQGNEVLTAVSYPNSLRADLAELSYGAALLDLPAGDYHYTLTAKLGFGEAVVEDTDFHYTGCDGAPVVYISDTGAGNGASPETPLGNAPRYEDMSLTSYTDSALFRALTMLSGTGGTVVVCDDVTLISGRSLSRYTASTSPFSAPAMASEQTVTLTSSYDGVDYRKTNGAQLILRRSGQQAVNLELNIGTVWSDIDLCVDYDYAILPSITISTIQAYVSCGREKTVFEPSVHVTLCHAGQTLDEAEYSKYLPRLYGGYYNLAADGSTDLTVLGGSWSGVVGGSHESYLSGGTKLVFGGEAAAYEGIFGGGSDNRSTLCGDVDVQITGGTVRGKLVAGGSSQSGAPGRSVRLTVSGTPDLSGVRIINAGGADAETTLDMGQFQYRKGEFTAYYNEAEFAQVIAPQERAAFPIVPVAAGAAVVLAAVIVLVAAKKRKAQAKSADSDEKGT